MVFRWPPTRAVDQSFIDGQRSGVFKACVNGSVNKLTTPVMGGNLEVHISFSLSLLSSGHMRMYIDFAPVARHLT